MLLLTPAWSKGWARAATRQSEDFIGAHAGIGGAAKSLKGLAPSIACSAFAIQLANAGMISDDLKLDLGMG